MSISTKVWSFLFCHAKRMESGHLWTYRLTVSRMVYGISILVTYRYFVACMLMMIVGWTKDLWINGQNTQFAKYIVGGTQKPYSFTDIQYFVDSFSMHTKAEGMTQLDISSCLCRKFSQLRALLFLSSTQTSQNLKFIQKCPYFSNLKNKFQSTQKNFWPLIRRV